jgi:hypothetical protein
MIPGAATGSTTNMRRCRMVQPSILAESSMSFEILSKYPHLQSVHFSTLPAAGETGETALEWAPRRPPRRERSVLAAREDLSRHLGRDYPQPQGPFGYPWFSAFFLPCSQGGCSQGGRAILNFLLPRNDITTLCSTMKRYSKSPLTIA